MDMMGGLPQTNDEFDDDFEAKLEQEEEEAKKGSTPKEQMQM